VGSIKVKEPITGEDRQFTMPAGGRGYTRPPSLISLWSTAPYLLNNTVGDFSYDPSVEARMKMFQVGIEQMLWPEKRERDPILGDKGVGIIDRTTETSWLTVPSGFLPESVRMLRVPINWLLPGSVTDAGDLRFGPIPKGTPVGLIGNFDPLPQEPGLFAGVAQGWRLLRLALRMRHDVVAAAKAPPPAEGTPPDSAAIEIFQPLARELYDLNICPDFVVNRGHYFGTDRLGEETGLSDADKRALIEFLKTF
jgi:hypothetical protein